MDIHKNARLTVYSREQLAKKVLLENVTLNSAAAEFKVSPKTAAKWVCRYRSEGAAGLRDRSSRPHRLYRPTPVEVIHLIETLRRQRWTGFRIADQTQLSRATVSRILRRLGLSRIRDLQPAPVIQRYEHKAPGDLLHLDIKKLGRIARPSHRVTGDRRDSVEGIGWEYVHVAIDDHSRIAFSAIYPDETRQSVIAFLYAALDYYARLGIRFKAPADRQRRGLPFPSVRCRLSKSGAEAPLYAPLHSSYQWQGQAVHPDGAPGMAVRPHLSELISEEPGAALLASPLQLASTAC